LAHPTIKIGSQGSAVRLAQRRLKARAYYDPPGRVDGWFGPKTERAVKSYQRHRDLDADGIIGPRTWARLDPPTVQSGSEGDAVELLQRLLKQTNVDRWDPGAVDGDFGPNTERAVKNFQRDTSLEDDGIVGPETWAMLWS
jgi:peptidoglycan hydrolase-like protein with peptidoglycan-binding domain